MSRTTASNTATNMVTTIPAGGFSNPFGLTATPDGGRVYVTNQDNGPVSVIATSTNTVTATIPVGMEPSGVAVTPDGSKVYVVDSRANTVSVIATATNTVIATIQVGSEPVSFGIFIQPPPRFAGMPGKANCYGQSVSA